MLMVSRRSCEFEAIAFGRTEISGCYTKRLVCYLCFDFDLCLDDVE